MCEKAFSINVFSSFKIKTLVFYTTITQHNIIWSWSVKFEKQTTNYDFGIGSLYFLRSNLSRENEISYGKMRPVFIGRSLDETFSVSRLFVFPRGIQRGVAPLMQGWKKNTGADRNKDVRPEETFQNGNRPWDCRIPIQNTPQKALYQQQCFCSTEIQVARKSVCVELFFVTKRTEKERADLFSKCARSSPFPSRFHLPPPGSPRGMTKQHWRNHNAKYRKKP